MVVEKNRQIKEDPLVVNRRRDGRRINYLKKAIDIQEIVKQNGKLGKGYSQRWIFRNIISAPGSAYHMSYAAFNNYLSVSSPQTELEKLLKNDN